jgi:hypothetical protein
METVLGLLGMLVWIAGVMALAAGVTYAVIRLSPGERNKSKPEESSSPSSS